MPYNSNKIEKKIEKTRSDLENLINKKGNLLDPDVTYKSQELDNLLNQYNKLFR